MPNFFSPLAGFFKKIGGAGTNARTPGFVPESVGREVGQVGGGVLPTAEAVPNLSITPKPSLHPPVVLGRDRVYANPLARDTMSIGADTSRLQQEAVPRLAGRDVKTELALRANDPNPDVRFDTPMQQARYDYVTRNGDPRETHRGFKAGAKDFFRGGQASVKQLPPGSSVAEVLGAFLGGGTGSTITGKVDPVALEERNFEVFKAPELYRDQRDRNEQQRVQADIQYRQSQAQREKMQADVAREEQDRKNAGGVPVGARGNIINGQIVGAPAEKSPTPHWVLDDNGQYVNLNAAKGTVRGPDKSKDMSPSEALALGQMETDANFDPSKIREQWMGGVRPMIDQRLQVSPQMRALAQNPQKLEDGSDWTPESKLAMQRVQQAENQLEQEFGQFLAHKKKELAAQAATKKYSGAKAQKSSGKSSVNLYNYDSQRYGFKD